MTPRDDPIERAAARLRAEYPWADRTIYFNHASTGPIPESTQRAIDVIQLKRREPFRFGESEHFDIMVEARAAVAGLIGAEPAEIALAPNTSYGINVAANVLPLGAGDVVLLPDGEFPANVYPWLLLQRRGVRVEIVPRTAAGWPDELRLLDRLPDPKVKALAISFVQFATGFRVDLPRVSAACREHGVFLALDAIQGIGQVPLDVRRTPVDLMACGAQKWLLGPWGAGFVYVRKALLPQLEPTFTGWLAFRGTEDFGRLTGYDTVFHPDGRRFELVTLPYQDLVGMTASVRLLGEVGVDRIAARLRALRAPLEAAADRGTLTITSPLDPAHDSGMWCVRTTDTPGAFHRLRAAGVACALREGNVRLAPHGYNTVDEVERVIALLAG